MLSANIPNATRRQVYARDGYRCALCDSTNGLQIHHFIKRSEGGSNQLMNLITLCWKCHAAAHGTTVQDYPDYVTADYIEQAVAEYLGDYYLQDFYPFGED